MADADLSKALFGIGSPGARSDLATAGSLRIEIPELDTGNVVLKTKDLPVNDEAANDWQLLTLGRIAEQHLGGSSLINLFVHIEDESCTTVLGEGSYGVVLKACSVVNPAEGKCDGCVAIKYGNDDDLRIEATAWRQLSKVSAAAPFQPQYINSSFFKGFGAIITELIEPWKPGIGSLRQFFRDANPREVETWTPAILLQIVWWLAAVQHVIPGFRHNDLLTKNIMITENKLKKDITLGILGTDVRFSIPAGAPLVKITDFGLTWAPNGKIPHKYIEEESADPEGKDGSGSELYDSGIVPVPSALYDLFSITFDIQEKIRDRVRDGEDRKSMSHDELEVLKNVLARVTSFRERVLGPLAREAYLIRDWMRLSIRGQKEEARMIEDDVVFAPIDLLGKSIPLFEQLRKSGPGEGTMFEIDPNK